jgi:peptidoglycan hydrolase-like protein with peptidoglycan-binding domain
MKWPTATVLVLLFAANPALAQNSPSGGQPSPIKPKPVATTSVSPDGTSRPKLQTPAETAKAMAQAERLSIQSDLAWTSNYNGVVNGEVSDRMVAAIKAFQKGRGGKDTGVLNPQERSALTDAARKLQANVGWKIATDMVTGARLGLPLKLVPNTSSDANGSKWSSPTGTVVIALDRRKQAGASIASVADSEKKSNARRIEYSAVKPDFFVLSGLQGLKKFYIRGETRGDEVRMLTILYDQALEGTMAPVTVAMSSAFIPFPGNSAQPTIPRNTVEYSTGIVVSADGTILADRQSIDGCESVIVSGHDNAEKIAQDDTSDLALLRVYGATGLHPLAITDGAAKSSVTVTGIPDPQNQNGGDAITSINATAGAGGSEALLAPAPPLGLSGAALTDSDGKFAGVARLRPVSVAGPGAGMSGSFVPANVVREFLTVQKVALSSEPENPKNSVVRLICVRK